MLSQTWQDNQSLWHNRRVLRSLQVAVTLTILFTACFFYWPAISQFPLDTIASFSSTAANNSTHQSPSNFTHDAIDATRVALLMETRPLPHLPALLSHFISILPPAWTFRFVGSPTSLALISSSKALAYHIGTGKLVLTEMPAVYAISSGETVSATLTNLSFYKDFLAPAEWLLVFQSDSIVCAASEHSIEDWVRERYTWLGAPWHLGKGWGGNGGLSLRHVPPIIELLERETREPGSDMEDRWLCDRLGPMESANMPGPEIERHFSVESVWTERPWGYHLRDSGKSLVNEIWGNETRRKEIFSYCPEIKIILDLDME